MFQAGVSILLTSLTDVIGFYSAILAPYPYVQIFCIYTGFYSKNIYVRHCFLLIYLNIMWNPFFASVPTLQQKSHLYSQKRNCAASVPISTFMCLRAIYTPKIWSRIGKLVVEYINRSQTHECENSFSGNICFEFSVLCLCIATASPLPRWDHLLWKTQAQNSHAWAPLNIALCCMPYSIVLFSNMYKLLIILFYCIN
jgi:hypothetical protein